MSLISRDRSIIIACDVELPRFEEIVKQTCKLDNIGGYKAGFALGLEHGLPKVVKIARKYTDKPIIYDHQKAGTDVPFTGELFAKTLKKAGIDCAILFPQAGPETEKAWIKACQEQGLIAMVGGWMTHDRYAKSEGGWLDDDSLLKIYEIAVEMGVQDFVVPGKKPEVIQKVKKAISARGVEPVFYAPGFISQGGSLSEAAKVAGKRWHAIVGRAITQADDIRKACKKLQI